MEQRVEAEVVELVRKSGFKQCYTLLAQWRGRYPQSSFLEVLELYVKYKHLPRQFDAQASLVEPYCSSEKGLKVSGDANTLDLLHRFFCELGMYGNALKVYEVASLKYSNNLELSYEFFCKTISDGNFESMTKATAALSALGAREDPKNQRSYWFWNAIATIATFRYQRRTMSEQEAKILPLLCYQRLSKLKPFQTIQEVIIFCTVCEELFPGDETKSNEIIEVILPHLRSSVDLYLKNFMLRHLKDSQLMFDYCQHLLSKIDDFNLIKALIKSAKQLGKSRDEINQVIKSAVGDSRNFRLSCFEIDIHFGSSISEELLTFYLSKFHHKQCCSIDLNHYMDKIDKTVLTKIFKSLEINGESNESTAIHDSNMFILGLNDNTDSVTYYNKNKTSLSHKCKTDYSTNAVFIMDIVQKVLKRENKPTLQNIILSICILENYQQKDPFNYSTGVWLIALYMQVGLTPIAAEYYHDFKVKNVQSDSMDFLLYSRYSSIFPNKQHDYLMKTIKEHNNLYDTLDRLSKLIQISFERKSYSKIFGMLELNDKLIKSMNRWMNITENLHLARLCNEKRGGLLQELHKDWRQLTMINQSNDSKLDFSDSRDWSIFGDYTKVSEVPESLDYLRISESNIMLNCIREFMIESIPLGTKNSTVDSILLETDVTTLLGGSSYTDVEKWSFSVFYDLYSNEGKRLESLLDEMKNAGKGNDIGSWYHTHNYLIKLSTLKTLDNIKKLATAPPTTKKRVKQELQAHRGTCDDTFAEYKKSLREHCQSLQSDSDDKRILEALDFGPLGHESIINAATSVQKAVRNL